ncbi:MAG: hypothetical protein LC122_12885 [Chitinophagales bacterium]|nr:hypothetical protein [Chitinophagales bacterium]
MYLKDLLKSIEKIAEDNNTSVPYICGGTPRDKVLNKLDKIADLDITTGDQTINLLGQEFYNFYKNKFNIKNNVGKDGHLTVHFGNLKVDFSSNFIIPNIDSVVKLQTKLEKETYSRDFTCNALLMDLSLDKIIDPTKRGIKDINSKIVDTCLNPEVSLPTKSNRVLRAIYLAVKLDFDIHPRVIKWITDNPIAIQNSSYKSMQEKLNICASIDKERTIKLLRDTKVYFYIPPEILLENNLK